MLAGCEACSEDAEIPIDNILARLTGSDPSVTDYVLETGAERRDRDFRDVDRLIWHVHSRVIRTRALGFFGIEPSRAIHFNRITAITTQPAGSSTLTIICGLEETRLKNWKRLRDLKSSSNSSGNKFE